MGEASAANRPYYRPADVARLLRCSQWWVKEQARHGRIPFSWIGGSYLFTERAHRGDHPPVRGTAGGGRHRDTGCWAFRLRRSGAGPTGGGAQLVARVPRRVRAAQQDEGRVTTGGSESWDTPRTAVVTGVDGTSSAPGRYATVVDTTGATMRFRDASGGGAGGRRRRGPGTATAVGDPRAAGRVAFGDYVNDWFARQDLAVSTMQSYRGAIEGHLLPAFEDLAVGDITPPRWRHGRSANGRRSYAAASIRLWRRVLHLILADAVDEGIRESNPAAQRRGRGKRAGRSQHRAPEKTITTALGVLLLAERAALLSGRDDEFVALVTLGFTGLRWAELVGLETRYVRPDAVRVEWQLYELDTGELVRCPPKDDSYRTVHVPDWLGSLLTAQVGRATPQPCACHGYRYTFGGYGTANGAARRVGPKLVDVARAAGVSTGTVSNVLNRPEQVTAATRDAVLAAVEQVGLVRGAPTGGGRHRTTGATASPPGCSSRPRPAATRRRHPGRPGRCRCTAEPWPGVPVRGRNAAERAEACWLPIAPGLTPHGLRHSYKTLMLGLGTPSAVMDEQMGHADGSVQARYSHVTPDMIRQLLDGLTDPVGERAGRPPAVLPGSAVRCWIAPARRWDDKIVSQNSPKQTPETEKAGPRFRDTGPDLLFYGRADRI